MTRRIYALTGGTKKEHMDYVGFNPRAKSLYVNNGGSMANLGNDEVESSILSRGTSKADNPVKSRLVELAHNAPCPRPAPTQGEE